MLNISLKSVSNYLNKSEFRSYETLSSRTHSKSLLKALIVLSIILMLGMFLPWTQNIRSNGTVTTLNPYDKPQNIQALIGGQIEKWYVTQGDLVNIGDTIVKLTEAKEEYFDPKLLANTNEQRLAKLQSANAYNSKSRFLADQLIAIEDLRQSKLQQLKIKQQQINLEIESMQQEKIAADTYLENAKNQLDRMMLMYDKGIKSLTELEAKRLSLREAEAKILSINNKLLKQENDKLNVNQEVELTNSDYNQKKAKIASEINAADSYRFSLLGESNKLESKVNQLIQREKAFVITSPVAGRINKVLKNGIGEYIKAQDNIATIVPNTYQKAVELYIEPMDMPLIKEGKKVRIQFDGWPAIVFSGWPNNSFGTFGGIVYSIDNDISENGKYRLLVIEDDIEKPWPDLIRIGSGARGLLLLNDVKVYYEIWRKLNGFPPDFYNPESSKKVKNKVPLRKIK